MLYEAEECITLIPHLHRYSNTVFYKNTANTAGDAIYNGSSSSIKSTSTHNASDASLGKFPNTKIDLSNLHYKNLFADSTNFIGVDSIWGTADDGLIPINGSVLISAGDPTGATTTDITGKTRPTIPSTGAYEFTGCASNASLPIVLNTTYTSTQKTTDASGWTNYCTENGDLLLSLEIGISGAVIDSNKVQLRTGNSRIFTYTGTMMAVL